MRKDIRTDGQEGVTEPIVTFRNFANSPKSRVFNFSLSCYCGYLSVNFALMQHSLAVYSTNGGDQSVSSARSHLSDAK
jgi:hypothetical protein